MDFYNPEIPTNDFIDEENVALPVWVPPRSEVCCSTIREGGKKKFLELLLHRTAVYAKQSLRH